MTSVVKLQDVYRYDIAEDWYRYRQAALEQIAIDWLEAHAIPYEINGDRPTQVS